MTRSFGWLKKTPQISTDIKIAAIDDFALKKRHNYGTVLIDAKDHRIVDMIESRDKEDVTEWLCSFRNIEIFTRDGSSSYAVSISDSHPDALQIMDRFHILLHLTDYGKDYINRTVKAAEPIESEEITQKNIPHFETTHDKIMAAKALKKQDKTYVEISNELFVSEMTARKYVNISEEEAEKYKRKTDLQRSEESADAKEKMFNEIHLLHEQGLTNVAISRRLGTTEVTVSRYLKLSEPPRRAYNSQRKREKIEPFIPRINELGEQGYKNKEIVRILKAEGCTCGDSYIGKIITEQRKLRFAAPKKKVPRKALISLLYRSLDKVTDLSEDDLRKMIERYPMLEVLYDLTRSFKEILFSKKSELLESWLDTAEASGIPELKSFANGIRQDLEATKAGIKYSYSNGIAEGNVNKIKMIKRRMYGRCSFELLRAAVLLNQNG